MRETVLIADESPASRIILRSRLIEANYQTLLAVSGLSCLQMAISARPAVIVLDGYFTDISTPDLIARLRADPVTAGLPLLVLCETHDLEGRLAALEAGADEVIARPPDPGILSARIGNLLRRGREANLLAEVWGSEHSALSGFAEARAAFQPPGSIGVIAERAETALVWRMRIPQDLRARAHMPLTRPGNPGLTAHDIYLICTDSSDNAAGMRMMSQLAVGQSSRDSLCCLVVPETNVTAVALAFDLGADDVIDPSITPAELSLRLRNMLRRKAQRDHVQQRIRDGLRQSLIDPLTGAWNRRYALPRLEVMLREARERAEPLALMVIDLDRFKAVNDSFGHRIGDQVLSDLVQRLSANLRAGDLLARVGGEEFLLVLPCTGPDEAMKIAQRLRGLVAERPFRITAAESPLSPGCPAEIPLTISIGLRVSSGQDTPEALIEAADQGLRRSKQGGRNLVTVT